MSGKSMDEMTGQLEQALLLAIDKAAALPASWAPAHLAGFYGGPNAVEARIVWQRNRKELVARMEARGYIVTYMEKAFHVRPR